VQEKNYAAAHIVSGDKALVRVARTKVEFLQVDQIGAERSPEPSEGKFNIDASNEAAPLSRSGSWVLHDLLIILLVFTLRFPSL